MYFLAMVYHLDLSVGDIVEALSKRNMLENSVIIFSTDNGGPAAGFNLNAASNYPLRGVKNTLWEGGIRGAAFVWSPLFNSSQRVSNQLFHISDWLPTLLKAAGNVVKLNGIDGIDQFEALASGTSSNPRTEILHNIDNIWNSSAIMMHDFKLVKGTNYNGSWDFWYGPEGNRKESTYDAYGLFTSKTARALKKIEKMPTYDKIL
jgi:arylsulfatase A-like enzyme